MYTDYYFHYQLSTARDVLQRLERTLHLLDATMSGAMKPDFRDLHSAQQHVGPLQDAVQHLLDHVNKYHHP